MPNNANQPKHTPREIEVEGHKLVALAFNPDSAGSPIILLHGITSSVHFWEIGCQYSLFSKYGPCYAISLPGHYPAKTPPDFQEAQFTPYMFSAVLTKAIQALVGDQPVTLVGHSTGAFAALNIGSQNHTAAGVNRIISISGFASGKWAGLLGFNQWLAQQGLMGKKLLKTGYKVSSLSRFLVLTSYRAYISNYASFSAYPHLKNFLDYTQHDLKHFDLDTITQYFAAMPAIDISDALNDICVPTLVLTGDQDPIVPPEQSYLIADKVPQAKLEVITNAGHLLFAEKPQEYNRILNQWLDVTSL